MSELGVYNSSIVQPKGFKPLKSAPTSDVSSITKDISDMDIGVRKPQVKGKGKVKAVLSGDTIVIKGTSGKEKRLVVSGVNAPRIGNRKAADEPFGYQAREFLRSKLQDKVVEFVLHTESSNNDREFADISIGGVDIAKMIISAGYAKVAIPKAKEAKEAKDDKKAKPFDVTSLHPEKQALYKLQKEAEAKKLGMFSGKEPNTRTMDYEPDMLALYNTYKGQTLKAFVDRVLDGTTFRMEIANPAGSLNHTVFTLSLAGALSPRTPMKDDKNAPQPCAIEAYQFAEARLLGRDVTITIQGIDKAANIYGTVSMPQGNIAVRLVETGLAKFVSWTAAVCTADDRAALEIAHATSSALKHGVYAADASKPVKEQKEAFDGTVTQIHSGDTFTVRDRFEVDHRISLADVQAPRYRAAGKSEPFAFEAREFLRKSLIGKRVRVSPEYEREFKVGDASEARTDTRVYATVHKNKYNVATELINAGLGDVSSIGKDAARSANYMELCNTEAAVRVSQKGKFSKKTVPAVISDLCPPPVRRNKDSKDEAKETKDTKAAVTKSGNSERVMLALNKIKDSQVHAVLEYVSSPTRIKVYVPTLHAYISVSIAGVTSPAHVKGEPRSAASEQAIAFMKKYTQQDIVIEVSSIGRGDVFVANVFHKESSVNFAVSLVKEGLVSVLGFSADRNKFKTQLYSAEKDAKKARKGIWEDFDEEKEAALAEKARQEAIESIGMGIYSKDGNQYLKVCVTDVVDPIRFYINNTDDKNVALIKEKMSAFTPADAPEDFAPTKGALVCALFSEDGLWYRARVENVSIRANRYSIQYIDFGNVDEVELSSLRPIPEELAKIKQLARPCTLSAVKPPVKGAYFTQGAEALFQYTNGLEFEARIDYTESGSNGVLHLTLFHETDPAVSINAHMLKSGWVKVNTRPIRKLDNIAAELEEFQLDARDNHRGIWEYGDCGSDMDE